MHQSSKSVTKLWSASVSSSFFICSKWIPKYIYVEILAEGNFIIFPQYQYLLTNRKKIINKVLYLERASRNWEPRRLCLVWIWKRHTLSICPFPFPHEINQCSTFYLSHWWCIIFDQMSLIIAVTLVTTSREGYQGQQKLRGVGFRW